MKKICPACGSTKLELKIIKKFWGWARAWICKDCGKDYYEEKTRRDKPHNLFKSPR